ncbi:hypothetical protein D3C87_1612680 [compost metagenome]
MLMRMALAIWLLAPAPWLTPSTPLPLLKEVPPMVAVAFIDGLAEVLIFWLMRVVAAASVPMAIARTLVCCCWSPAAWLTLRLPVYWLPESWILALFTVLTLESAMALVQPSRARTINERVMSLASSQSAQWGEAGTQGTVDGSRDRPATAATVARGHARHAVGVGDHVEALHA